MAKLRKIGSRSLGIASDLVVLLLIGSYFCLRSPQFQTYLAHEASSWLSSELGVEVSIGKLDIAFFDRVYLSEVYMEDQSKDTLAYLGEVELNMHGLDWSFAEIEVDRLRIQRGTINLRRKNRDEDFNYMFLSDYFASDEPRKPRTKKGPKISIAKLSLSQIDFKYVLEYKDDYQYGINFNKLDLKNIDLEIAGLAIQDEHFNGEIKHLSASEISGFFLKDFFGKFDLDKKHLTVSKAKIKTEKTEIDLEKLHFKMRTWDNYNYFEDSVQMHIRLAPSSVNLADIAYFSPNLWGMEEQVKVSGLVKDYVYNLKIKNLDLAMLESTRIRGDFALPDFRLDDYEWPRQHIVYLKTNYSDLQALKIPHQAGETPFIQFPQDIHTQRILNGLGVVEISYAAFQNRGNRYEFIFPRVSTEIGTLNASEGILVFVDSSNTVNYKPAGNGIRFQDLDLAVISGTESLGLSSGVLRFDGKGTQVDDMVFNKVEAEIEFLDFEDYRYKNIKVKNAIVTPSQFDGLAEVNDPNAVLQYEGTVKYDSSEEIAGLLSVTSMSPTELGFSDIPNLLANGVFEINTSGFDGASIAGSIVSNQVHLERDSLRYDFQGLRAGIDRSGAMDVLRIDSDLISGRVEGILDFDAIIKGIQKELALVLPFLVPELDEKNFVYSGYANFDLKLGRTTEIFDILMPELHVEKGSRLTGSLNGKTERYEFQLDAPEIAFEDKKFLTVHLRNEFDSTGILAAYSVQEFLFNDSLSFKALKLDVNGTNALFNSSLNWGADTLTGGDLNWLTRVNSKDDIFIDIKESSFYMEQDLWKLDDFEELGIAPTLHFRNDKIEVRDIMFLNALQYVNIDGFISNDIEDALEILVSDFDVKAINKLYFPEYDMTGLISGNFALHNVLDDVLVEGILGVDDLTLNDNYIGTLNIESNYDAALKQIFVKGDLANPTISKTATNKFNGTYTFSRTVGGRELPDVLDFSLDFATMDIAFTEAFIDPEIASDIKGTINGQMKVKGSSSNPLLVGELKLEQGGAKIGLLGTKYELSGPINVTNYGFSIINMPILDEEKNAGRLSASIFHENFVNWNYNVFLDLKRDGIKKDPNNPSQPAYLDRFLALNTTYTEGDIYYGRGYVTGNVNIYGNDEVVEITANVKSERGTEINFPMYGSGEIGEDDFVVFINNVDSTLLNNQPQIDFTGVRLNLNIEATEQAKMRIIFDERSGDEISGRGKGKFRISLDELNDVTMSGTFEVEEGAYNFAMGVVKKQFTIEPGSTVKWLGDPYEASLDVRTFYKVEANIQDLSAIYDPEAEGRTTVRDDVFCYLTLKNTLLQPVLEFDLEAPRASDQGKVALNRVRSDEDEMTRQFFSLLLMNQFIPLRGTTAGTANTGSNAIYELLTNQINAALDQISGNYDFQVKLNDDVINNQSTYELGFSSTFLDDRLLVSGSFGVSQFRNSAVPQGTNPLIGDVNLEYKLNKAGTFRVNVFNRSNQVTVINQQNLGLFTQGVGVYYRESFSTWEDFQLAQFGLDVFRPYEQKRYKRLNDRLIPLPPLPTRDSIPASTPDTIQVPADTTQNNSSTDGLSSGSSDQPNLPINQLPVPSKAIIPE